MKNFSKNYPIVTMFIIVLFLFDGCKKENFPVPPASTVPSFTYTIDNNGLAPATVTFKNNSIVPSNVGTATFYWDFGDSTSTDDENPSHIFLHPGAYKVNLVVVTSVSLEVKESSKTILIKDPNANGTPIYFTDGSFVYRGLVNNAAPIFEQLPIVGLQDSYGMAFDTLHSKIYISDYETGQIWHCNLDGSEQTLFRSGLDNPDALTIDYLENTIYWDNNEGIQKADLSNTDVNQKVDFVTGQANNPDGICIDPVSRTMFWVNYNGGVWKKNLDGSGEALLIPTVGGGGSLIVANDKIYFDDYVGAGDIRIQSANLDGTGIALLAAGISRVVYGLGFDSIGQKIYWGDRDLGTIVRANLDGSFAEPWYNSPGSNPRGIVFGKPL